MRQILIVVFAITAGSVPALAFAQSNVAVAYSDSTQDVGFAEEDSESAASDKAMAECGKGGASDCSIAFSGSDMCVSLARATSKPAFGIGAGSSRQSSQDEALAKCAEGGAEGCNIHDTYCAPSNLE
ncbi:DUF4189 domain-containing protein [Martelella limonii]|uniref:DUF4189 domain-containing protein n=1 Tax=Martelella limonii TaxID=1647649 RepID=UPI001FCEDA17|nr:DUF4189 domain-containing protein [Martelella limonii]